MKKNTKKLNEKSKNNSKKPIKKSIKKSTKKVSEEKVHATFNLVEVIIIVMITIIVVSVGSGMLVFHNYEKLIDKNTGSDKYLKEFEQTYNKIVNDYVDTVNKEELVTSAIEGMFEYLDEPNSNYLDQTQTDELNERLNGTYEGIGVEIEDTENGVKINRVFSGTPAKSAGIKKSDIVTKINNLDVSKKSASFVSNYIRYKLDSKFTLEIKRDGKTKKYLMKKTKIDYPVIYTETYDKTGYIYLTAFSKTSAEQFKDAIKELENQKIEKLVIDLRYNTGGYLNSAYDISELFLPKGDVVYQLKTKTKITKYKAKKRNKIDYPISIIINSKSASASEILTLALKQNLNNVTVVGEKSYGKGTVQQASDLENGSMVKYTTANWLSPIGESINKEGIMPDYTIILDEKTLDEDIDNQLQKALDVLK